MIQVMDADGPLFYRAPITLMTWKSKTMTTEIRQLEPQPIWTHFADLNEVPRPSKKEARVIEFMKNFGERLGLETRVDDIGNVIIRKPATPGMEDRTPVVIQGHLDMVCQKNADTDFDFDNQGIDMYVDGDWVKARGTTLGADNGIGVASAMAILASTDIAHPPIEALFTIDEETGMTGAQNLAGGVLRGRIMLNLDTEDDDEITIGCAGGVDVNISGRYQEADVKPGSVAFTLTVKGLAGGHSGMDIHLGRGNANKLLARLLLAGVEGHGIGVAAIDSGGLRNAIPREGSAVITVDASDVEAFKGFLDGQRAVLKAEYATTDPQLAVVLEPAELPAKVMDEDFQGRLLRAVRACPHGIHRMSPDVEDLVQTSNNIARVLAREGEYKAQCLTRGSVDSEKMDLAEAIRATFELIGANVRLEGAYPGWAPRPDAPIVKLMGALYEEMFGAEAPLMACHAGLECGILGSNYPEMQMISFGPNIRGAHSPDEKVQISSVQKFWGYLLETLKRIPPQ
jgi:dipeptidase D